jgi:hypothetical protein
MTILRLDQSGLVSEESLIQRLRELRDQRVNVQAQLQSLMCDQEAQIGGLDDALRLIAKAGILFRGLPPEGQRELLRLMVERVVLDPKGEIIRMELYPPFGYLARLITDTAETARSTGTMNAALNGKTRTVEAEAAGSSFVKPCVPTIIGNEPHYKPEKANPLQFFNRIAYTQRFALKALLTIN